MSRPRLAKMVRVVLVILPLWPSFTQQRGPVPSAGKEVALGRQLALDTEQHEKMLRDPEVAEFVQRLAGTLAVQAALDWPVSVRVIDSADVRSLAFPGGFLFVSTGLITRTETEAELAGVLAHQIAHLAARHSPDTISRGPGTTRNELIRVYFGSWGPSCLRLSLDSAWPKGMVIRMRATERKADTMAMQYLGASRYDPLAVLEFFSKLRYDQPRLADRLSAEELIAMRAKVEDGLPPDADYIVSTETFVNIRARLIAERKLAKAAPPSLLKPKR